MERLAGVAVWVRVYRYPTQATGADIMQHKRRRECAGSLAWSAESRDNWQLNKAHPEQTHPPVFDLYPSKLRVACCSHAKMDRPSDPPGTRPVMKRKQGSHSIVFKMQIFEEVDKKELSKVAIFKKHGIAPPTSSTFLKNRGNIEDAHVKNSFQPERKRMRLCAPATQQVKETLERWFT